MRRRRAIISFPSPSRRRSAESRGYLDRLLAERDRNRAEIAETLGISERNLYRMLRGRQGQDDRAYLKRSIRSCGIGRETMRLGSSGCVAAQTRVSKPSSASLSPL